MEEVNLLGIFISALLINNILLIRFLGLCSFFGVSSSIKSSLGMSAAVFFVMTMASIVSWILYHCVLMPLQLEFLRTATFIIVIASLVQLEEIFMKKFFPKLYKALGVFLPLVTTNCAILAVAFLNIDYNFSFIRGLIYTWGVASGYTIAILIFASIRERVELAPVPEALKGYPISFFIAGLMSLSFLGFKGLFGL